MSTVTVELRSVAGTQAALGWAGAHTLVVDRPEGRAGGKGLGFNGAQLLALALGGCFSNDLRYVAEQIGAQLGSLSISVSVDLAGEPLVATKASMSVSCEMLDGSSAQALIDRAAGSCMVSNSLSRGVAVTIAAAERDTA